MLETSFSAKSCETDPRLSVRIGVKISVKNFKNEDSIFRIVHDDSEILVIEKRKAFNSQRSDEGSNEGLYEFVGRNLNRELFPVHRLDREVLGLMVFANTKSACRKLSEQFKDREVSKIYLAWVHHKVSPTEQHLVHYLAKNTKTNFTTVYPKPTEGAKKAELRLKVLHSSNEKSLLEIELLTGRSHQIRAQLSKVGHPIIADQKYSNRLSQPVRERFESLDIQLRAQSLGLFHPSNREFLEWKLSFSEENFF